LDVQISTKEDELHSAQAGLKHLEHSLDETHAGKQADRQEFIQRVQQILCQKGQLEKQLHVQKARIGDTQSSTVAAKLSAMNRRLAATQHQRALTERRLKEKQVHYARHLVQHDRGGTYLALTGDEISPEREAVTH
jgi:chromosome segregation ATPase